MAGADRQHGARPTSSDVTRLLDAAASGDRHAGSALLPLVYEELRRAADYLLSRERGPITLQPTALVHEAYLRLLGPEGVDAPKWENRRHFFGAAAIAMRRILIDRARHVSAARVQTDRAYDDQSLPGFATPVEKGTGSPDEMLALDGAMGSLATHDERQHEVVMLRFFAGLTIEQTAQVLGVSPATVKTDWTYARAWLMREMTKRKE